ncbi:hypothetical protein [Mycolicibacterium fortuitum]|uniref:hypothetical protein n=1 Tax=Mycolicibacterium fortuitum TaxID=1766 RepID=UPI00261C97F6|nr:hypothetical protein [Mycolicibacterium fortuitum]
MTSLSPAQPVWAGSALLNSVWAATGESPEWIADRTDALLGQLGDALGITRWDTSRSQRWEGSPAQLADIVRGNPVHEALPEGEEGEVIPSEGYAMVLSGVGPAVAAKVWIDAGSIGLGRRVPSHRLHIDLREAASAGITSEVGDAVCAAVASAWRPATLTLTDSATNRLARRGGWKIGAGYRTWISSEVGTVGRVADGLAATELAGGTLISAPDDWSAEQVVAAMTETLAANGLDEVPH